MENSEKVDKRKITASKNLEKARAKKLEYLRQQRELKEKAVETNVDVDDESEISESSESEEEIVYVKPRHKKKVKHIQTNDLQEIKMMLAEMKNEKAKQKKIKKVYVPQPVQTPSPAPVQQEIKTIYQKDEMINHMKHKLLNF